MRAQLIVVSATAISIFLGNTFVAVGDEDSQQRIQQGVDLIKLACGTGSSKDKLDLNGKADGSLTLKALPSLSAGVGVTYSKQEAQGLVAALRDVTTSEDYKLSEIQISCMKPYMDRIFDVIFPREKSSREKLMDLAEEYDKALRRRIGQIQNTLKTDQECFSFRLKISQMSSGGDPSVFVNSVPADASSIIYDQMRRRLDSNYAAANRNLDGLLFDGKRKGCIV